MGKCLVNALLVQQSETHKEPSGKGSRPFHPSLLLALLFYGYFTGVLSSRKMEVATYDSLAFRYLAGGHHPDHSTLAEFRERFLDELADLFVQIL